jgi:hypothetical protein
MVTSTLACTLACVLPLALAGCGRLPAAAPAELTAAELAPPTTLGRVTTIARASSRSLATAEDSVLFGDASDDTLLAVGKFGGTPAVVGRHAPLDVAVRGSEVFWIAIPGDTVYHARLDREPEVLLSNGLFTSVAAATSPDEVFLTKIVGDGGSLVRVRDKDVTTIATFGYRPRDVLLDDADAFVLTDAELHGVPRDGGEQRLVVVGDKLTGLALTRDAVFTTSAGMPSRMLLRVSKDGGRAEQLAWDVRNGPITAWDGWVYYLDARSPTLFRVPEVGGPPMPVARAPALGWATAMAADASAIYVAVNQVQKGMILAIAYPR